MEDRSAKRTLASRATAMNDLVAEMDALVEENKDFAGLEAKILQIGNELVRRVLERRLQRQADAFRNEVCVQGVHYRRHQPAIVEYHSLCGPIRIERWTYRQCGVRNGPTVVPVEIAAGLFEGATPALAYSVAQGYARMPTRDYQDELEAAHRYVPSRSTLERMGKCFGGVAKRDLGAVEPVLAVIEELPDDVRSVSVGLDRTTVPMIEERPRAQAPSTPRKVRTKPYQRRPPDPFDVAYRMAYVGTVTLHDAHGDAIRTWRFAATPEEGGDELVERMASQILEVRRRLPGRPLIVLQDGAPELWGLLGEAFHRHGLRADHQAIDRYHLNERLARVLEIIVPSAAERQDLFDRWQRALDRHNDAAVRIARFISREHWASLVRTGRVVPVPGYPAARFGRLLNRALLDELGGHLSYIESHTRLFRYAALVARNLPIGSGVTEAACKSVVAARFKRGGAHWYQDGLSACLTLRALLLSDRLRSFWACFRRRHTVHIDAIA